MFGPTIDVAIGLTLVYVLFSSLISVVYEALAGIRDLRSKALENAVISLIDDLPPTPGGLRGFVDKFFGLFGSQMRLRAEAFGAAAAQTLSGQVYGHALIAGLSVKNKPSYIPAENFAAALLAVVRGAATGSLASQVEQGIAQLPQGSSVRQALTTIVQDAQGDWTSIKAGVEGWFDAAMDRLSGDYKRFHQICAFIMGLSLAALCNVDSVYIVRTLYAQPDMTKALDAEAIAISKAGLESKPISNGSIADTTDKIKTAKNALFASAVPVGWDKEAAAKWRDPANVANWLPVALGWLLTALAGLLGAPFWFDSLQKLVNLRGAGPESKTVKPAKAA